MAAPVEPVEPVEPVAGKFAVFIFFFFGTFRAGLSSVFPCMLIAAIHLADFQSGELDTISKHFRIGTFMVGAGRPPKANPRFQSYSVTNSLTGFQCLCTAARRSRHHHYYPQ